jgi:phosphate transport system protein
MWLAQRRLTMSPSHPDAALERALRDVRQRLLFMMDLAEGMLWSAVLALVTCDTELARSVVEGQRDLERGQRELDTMCLGLFVTHGQAARELPLSLRGIKMGVDIARSGDVAVRIAHIASELAAEKPLYDYDDLLTLAGLVHGMLHDVRAAFADGDRARAEAVVERRPEVEALHARVFAELLERMRHDGRNVQRGTRLQCTAAALARVADHTENLARAVLDR